MPILIVRNQQFSQGLKFYLIMEVITTYLIFSEIKVKITLWFIPMYILIPLIFSFVFGFCQKLKIYSGLAHCTILYFTVLWLQPKRIISVIIFNAQTLNTSGYDYIRTYGVKCILGLFRRHCHCQTNAIIWLLLKKLSNRAIFRHGSNVGILLYFAQLTNLISFFSMFKSNVFRNHIYYILQLKIWLAVKIFL